VVDFEQDYFKVDKLKDGVITSIIDDYLQGSKEVYEKAKLNPVRPKKESIKELTNMFQENIKGVTVEMSKRIRLEIRESILSGESNKELAGRLDNIFKGDNPTRFRYENRLKLIARTEKRRAQSQGALDTAKEVGMTKKWLSMVDDARTSDISKAFHKKYGDPSKAIPINEMFTAIVGGKTWSGMTTPLHPNDRDTVIYDFE